VSTIEELIERQSRSSGVENRDYGPLFPLNLAITLPTNGGRSVGLVLSRSYGVILLLLLLLLFKFKFGDVS
jgi:hypothetical protein